MSEFEAYKIDPKHGVKPLCAFCDGAVDAKEISINWCWMAMEGKVYFAHSECIQNNLVDDEIDSFVDFLHKAEDDIDDYNATI